MIDAWPGKCMSNCVDRVCCVDMGLCSCSASTPALVRPLFFSTPSPYSLRAFQHVFWAS